MMRKISLLGLFGFLGLLGLSIVGLPMEALASQPTDMQMGFQPAASPNMAKITEFHNLLLWIITIITVFVLLLLVIIMVRFNKRSNPTPSKNTHNTLLEVVWTVVPILILVGIATQSFPLLYYLEDVPEADVTVKATGYQWYWGYGYPEEFGEEEFIANLCQEGDDTDDCADGHPRLLGTNFNVVVPVNKNIRVLVTAADVIHSWAIPAMGVKMDGVPGRLNETWFRADKEGIYYGQCSELCGLDHAFMPISLKVVSQTEYDNWAQEIRNKFELEAPVANNQSVSPQSDSPTTVAVAQ